MSIDADLTLAVAMFAAVAAGTSIRSIRCCPTTTPCMMPSWLTRAHGADVSSNWARSATATWRRSSSSTIASALATALDIERRAALIRRGRCATHRARRHVIVRISDGKIAEEWAVYDEPVLQRQLGSIDNRTTT